MQYSNAQSLYARLQQAAPPSSDDLSLLNSLKEKAFRYAAIRASWTLMGAEQRAQEDADRTRAHNAFIDSCNILSRHHASLGLDNTWRADLGTERKVIGDFACYIALFCALSAR